MPPDSRQKLHLTDAQRTWRRETYVPRLRPEGETEALIRASIKRASESMPRDRHMPACYRGGIR